MIFLEKLKEYDSIAFLYRFFKRIKIRHYYGLKFVHSTFNIGGSVKISKDFIAEEYSYVGFNCLIYPGVSIGRYTMIAQNVQIIGADHNFNVVGTPISFSGRPILKKTKIGRDVWIGANSIILTGVSIGDGAIISAGSVVTKVVQPYSIVGGVPAKEIKKRFLTSEEQEKHSKMLYGEIQKNRRNKPVKLSE